MPIALTNPGVYIQELPNPLQPIVGVPTAVTAFYGRAPQGQVDFPFQVNSWGDYESEFGGLTSGYPLSYAVYLFFLNGGSTALVVRYFDKTDPTYSVQLPKDSITLTASSSGEWGKNLYAAVDYTNVLDTANGFNLTILQPDSTGTLVMQEAYLGASLIPESSQYLPTLLNASRLIAPPGSGWTAKTPRPAETTVDQPLQFTTSSSGSTSTSTSTASAASATTDAGGGTAGGKAAGSKSAGGGSADGGDAAGGAADGGDAAGGATAADAAGGGAAGNGTAGNGAAGAQPGGSPGDRLPDLGDEDHKTGIFALLKADIFNILCLPVAPSQTYDTQTLKTATDFCEKYRAMLIVDPPTWQVPLQFADITTVNPAVSPPSPNAAVYYPNLQLKDSTGAPFNVGPCGAVAGVWAATDNNRGVWKAPAGTAASLGGFADFTEPVHDSESGLLNPIAVNALRTIPLVGPVVWGARTTVGADQTPNQWKYIPVRRLALYIEESLRRGLQWTVFEPNDEPLWSSLRLNVGTFMQGLFRQGAFAGTTADQAYLVQCDANNNPPDQVALGIVNVLVGFAPLYPAEFVIISIQQQAGQAST